MNPRWGLRTVEEHLQACLALARPAGGVESVDLVSAAGRVLAADVAAGADLPGFDNSAMDGYAVRAADVAGAGESAPVVLPVVADLPAGSGRPQPLPPGAAARIMTGAPLPEGADAVVQVEWTDAGTDRVRIDRGVPQGRNVRRAGDDVHAGDVVLRAGTRLSARHVALLAAVGSPTVAVRRRPRVVVISTGSELRPPGTPLAFGELHDSNGYALAVAATAAGAQARYGGNVADDAQPVAQALAAAAADADLVITSGGVSAGAYDVVKEVLTASGTVAFGKVAMQPGAPQGCGTLRAPDGRDVPVLTFPGNPVSALVSFEVFGRPVVRALHGEPDPVAVPVHLPAGEDWTASPGRRRFLRARLAPAADGTTVVVQAGGTGSHLVAGLAGATCLAVVPEDVDVVRAGELVACVMLEGGAGTT
ncbi:MAG: gephyrin-like molybdotransferase Glp [Kineosporiaceae bacterium]